MHLIAVVMGAETRDERNNAARTLLDYGFSNYAIFQRGEERLESIPVHGSTITSADAYREAVALLVKRSELGKIEEIYNIPEYISAPCKCEESIGTIEYHLEGDKIGESKIFIKDDIEKITLLDLMVTLLSALIR